MRADWEARKLIVGTSALNPVDEALSTAVGDCWDDPELFVMGMYPWGKPGPLEAYQGPDVWQGQFLRDLGDKVRGNGFDGVAPVTPIRVAVSSGHGVGKSALAAWLVDWIMSTRPNAQGTITANTFTQLSTKTWAQVKKWTALCATRHWFEINDERMYHKLAKDTWFCTPQSCKEENSEAFAGQHAATSTSFYIFDEDSGVPDIIHEVSEGGLTDGEPMIFRFGNCTRSWGDFHRICFGTGRDRWHPIVVDARQSALTNKTQIDEWEKDYGEDSDFFRVRVKGLPPRASELQFIDLDRVLQAQKRPDIEPFEDEALVAGVDVSDGGLAWNVVRFRCGLDARSIPPIRIPGEAVRGDRSAFLAKLADVLTGTFNGRKVSMMFVDSAFGAPYVERLKTMGHRNVEEVRFGAPALDDQFDNMRAYMWGRLKDWLLRGTLDPKDMILETDLTGPGYKMTRQDRIVLESKAEMAKRGVASPDDGDGLALTFAAPVRTKKAAKQRILEEYMGETGWMAR